MSNPKTCPVKTKNVPLRRVKATEIIPDGMCVPPRRPSTIPARTIPATARKHARHRGPSFVVVVVVDVVVVVFVLVAPRAGALMAEA